jgi:hypothetical protein
MYMADFYSNIMTKQYCKRTVRITNVQLENYKPYNTKEFKWEINFE